VKWPTLLRRDPSERTRKGVELAELHVESVAALRRAAEAERLAESVRNTVRAVRRETMT
jgi:hypothetical protein